CQQIYRSPVTF
nr:immunoglobulin light chain junction region [Macaca mulatta]MOX52013.1 immunoglobulin light chain junction region [Macaca mulatta]MOX52099.1 immunoglobulin light chain junction region [Macaca mulatta]MOX52287.1 immunoglobulin light chain junction region [Macaca mulatta]MOX52451.1 immunoglobulin light chain junction region [Macaca mulatta]